MAFLSSLYNADKVFTRNNPKKKKKFNITEELKYLLIHSKIMYSFKYKDENKTQTYK